MLTRRSLLLTSLATPLTMMARDYKSRVREVTRIPGFVALWDFVKKERGGERFDAHKAKGEKADLRLDALNYVREYWGEGRAATYPDFPIRQEGPFGQAVEFRNETDPVFRPLLLVPRARLHGSGIDVKGPGRSVTLVAWVKRGTGTHAIAGIWHEGTDLKDRSTEAKRVERGKRQYCLFAGLAAGAGASASHISDNGGATFDDRYARHLSVTPEKMVEGQWSCMGLVFDNTANTVTSYLDGKATEHWVETPEKHPFYQWAARAWARGEYRPPAEFVKIVDGKLAALRANPYWFPFDLYNPATIEDGGPFTIGRVIHSSRGAGTTGLIGGVAVFGRPLNAVEMQTLSALNSTGR